MSLARCSCWLAGMWAGVLLGAGAVAAPAASATLVAPDFGRFVGLLFREEAYLSLGVAVVLFGIERVRSKVQVESGRSVLNAELLLILGTLFCTVAGYFALLPLMEAARAGQGRWSFGVLHAVSGSFFVLKGLLVATLAWRLSRVATS